MSDSKALQALPTSSPPVGRDRPRLRLHLIVVVVVVGRSRSRGRASSSPVAQPESAPDDKHGMLYHERLDVYQLSIQFVAAAIAVSERIPRGYASLADQLRRAAMSIPLNIAEGVGKASKAEQARFHAVARGSAMECGAILDVVRVLRVESSDSLDQAKEMVVRIVGMLSKMCR